MTASAKHEPPKPPIDDDGQGIGSSALSSTEEVSERVEVAGQWTLIWWKFRRHKIAMAGGFVTFIIYFICVGFPEFFAPYPLDSEPQARYTYAPPHRLYFFRDGRLDLHTKDYNVEIEPVALRRIFTEDPESYVPVAFFGRGEKYKLWGIIEWDRHLIVPKDPDDRLYLLGADRLGRDLLSRMIYGGRISMSIGLVGVMLSLVFGVVLGGISGYFGGPLDTFIQRTIEFLRSIPTIPLWMALAAALPLTMDPLQRYFLITVILSLIGWAGLARVVRGRFFALKTEDFVTAAKLDGLSEMRIIIRHMVPSFLSHIIASVTLSIPGMILAETALSFLGLGLRSPTVSWGVLMKEAQNVRTVATAPWLMYPALAVIVSILALNFLGDGLRDAADPYEVV